MQGRACVVCPRVFKLDMDIEAGRTRTNKLLACIVLLLRSVTARSVTCPEGNEQVLVVRQGPLERKCMHVHCMAGTHAPRRLLSLIPWHLTALFGLDCLSSSAIRNGGRCSVWKRCGNANRHRASRAGYDALGCYPTAHLRGRACMHACGFPYTP